MNCGVVGYRVQVAADGREGWMGQGNGLSADDRRWGSGRVGCPEARFVRGPTARPHPSLWHRHRNWAPEWREGCRPGVISRMRGRKRWIGPSALGLFQWTISWGCTPGWDGSHLWCWGGGEPRMDADGRRWGREEGVGRLLHGAIPFATSGLGLAFLGMVLAAWGL